MLLLLLARLLSGELQDQSLALEGLPQVLEPAINPQQVYVEVAQLPVCYIRA